jgi:drug/metabolite transporter (DMT)-like permease|tara:strand:- start:1248 stop:2225 length:978 start_codon:yes stop_codon:yes gene_type:complete
MKSCQFIASGIKTSLNGYERNALLGWLSILAYCIFTGLSAVWVFESFSTVNGATLTFTTLMIAQIFFSAYAAINKESIFLFAVKNPAFVFKANILTLFSWYFMFLALQKLEASVESAIYQGIIPVVVLVFDALKKQGVGIKRALGPIMILLFLMILTLTRYDLATVNLENNEEVLEGILLAVIAGSAAGLYIITTTSAHQYKKTSLMEVLCTRFWGLLIITGYLGFDGIRELIMIDYSSIPKLIILSLMIVTLPVFLLQTGIKNLGGTRVSVITPLVPIIALSAEFFVNPWGSYFVPLLVIMTCISVIISNVWLKQTGCKVTAKH